MSLLAFLTDTLKEATVHTLLGQSSDGKHLPDKRITGVNLFKSNKVLQHIIAECAKTIKRGGKRTLMEKRQFQWK